MKTLIVTGDVNTYSAEYITKSEIKKRILGFDSNFSQIFSFKGINDFSLFSLAEGQNWNDESEVL